MDTEAAGGSGTPDFRPGDTITPSTTSEPTVPVAQTVASVVSIDLPPTAPVEPIAPTPTEPSVTLPSPAPVELAASTPPTPPADETPKPAPVQDQFVDQGQSFVRSDAEWAQTDAESEDAISWSAAEFIAHQKSASWYLALAGVMIVVAALIFLITHDKISTAVVLIVGGALGAYGARKPQQRQYALTTQGLSIGHRFFPYSQFRTFSVMDEDDQASITFSPLKRFGQLTTIYYPEDQEKTIVEFLANRLPMENRQHDAVDRFMKRIRF